MGKGWWGPGMWGILGGMMACGVMAGWRGGRAAAAVLVLVALAGCAPTTEESRRRSELDEHRPCSISLIGTIPIQVVHSKLLVPVSINGVGTVGQLDTGSGFTFVSPDFLDQVDAKYPAGVRNAGADIGFGLSGSARFPVAAVDQLNIGEIAWATFGRVGILPFADSGLKTNLNVLLGINLMQGLDFDLDFPHHLIRVYRAVNCKQVIPLWGDTETGIPMATEAITHYSYQHGTLQRTIPVVFDSETLNAIVDTGAERTYLTRRGAHRAGVSDAQLAQDQVTEIGGFNGKGRKVRRHKFDMFGIGEEILTDFMVDVAEEDTAVDSEIDMILGMDYFGKRRIWLSFGSNVFYIDSGIKRGSVPKS